MLGSLHTATGPSLEFIEFGLTLIVVALAICCPGTGSKIFSAIEMSLGRLARRRTLSIILCGVTAVSLRLLILPLSPIPHPWVQDDFSFLLAADTFSHGRLTNPTPRLWPHFESFHIELKPTYMSMYFPLQGLVMALGTVLAGHPWFGILAVCGLMCSALCWMLQGWLPPGWALFGTMLAVLRLALFSHWVDSYTGAGALTALGGALVFGALPRIARHFRMSDMLWMGLGISILATSRPYEGILISVPALAALVWWWFRSPRPRGSVIVRRAAPAVAVIIFTLVFMGYYDYKVFGSALTPPYKVNRETYAPLPHFLWQSPRPWPVYRHNIMRDFYVGSGVGSEMKAYLYETSSVAGFLKANALKVVATLLFYLNFSLLAPLIMLPWALGDRRMRIFVIAGGALVAGLGIETFYVQHYVAPATAILYALLLQCMRHLRVWRPAGTFLVRMIPVLCVTLALLRVFSQQLNIDLGSERSFNLAWYGRPGLGVERADVLAELERLPGPQLAIVPYSPHHIFNDWVYNSADIDKSKVVWARQMDPVSNRKLLEYYKDRQAWLVEPDCDPPQISPYPRPDRLSSASFSAMNISQQQGSPQ